MIACSTTSMWWEKKACSPQVKKRNGVATQPERVERGLEVDGEDGEDGEDGDDCGYNYDRGKR